MGIETKVTASTTGVRSVGFGFTVCCMGMMSLAIGINLLPVFFTTLQTSLGGAAGLTNEQLGRIMAVTFLGVVAATLATGPLADRYGPRPFGLIGNALIIVGLLMLSLANGYNAVLWASLVMGIGAGTVDMVLSPIVGALKPHNRSSAMNWLHSFYTTGAMVTVMIAATALYFNISWKAAAVVLIILPVLVFIGFLLIHIPPMAPEASEGGKHRLRDMSKVPFFWAAMAAIAMGGATELGMASWLPAYAEKSLGYTTFQGALAFTGFLAAMSIGRIFIGIIGNPGNIMKLLKVCCLGSIVFFLAASFAPWPGVALTSCILAGLAGSALWPSMLAITADHYPRGGATMYGALAGAGNAGAIVMPWIVGLAADHWTMSIGIATGAICPAVMWVILLGMRGRQKA